MPLFELGVILDPEATTEEETQVLERLEAIITSAGGEVVDKDVWGRRQLAYPIRKKNYGSYQFWKFNVGGDVMAKLNFELRTNDLVMRSLILNLDRELKRKHKMDRQEKAKVAHKAAKAAAAAERDTAEVEQ
jgi:small subunit ribosomal protein S6